MYTRKDIAKAIDHAVLKPCAVDTDVIEACKLCDENGVGCIIVRPTDVKLTVEQLKDSVTKVGTVIGFPHGSDLDEVKTLQAELAIDNGADELDMVMNIGRFLSGDYDFVQKDIEAVVTEAKKHGKIVKVILETCFLTKEQIAGACKIAEAAGADYVKTSTGFADAGATHEAVEIMVKTVGKTMGIKASGGIRSYEDAVSYLEQGCSRLGISSTLNILNGAAD